MKNNMIGNKYLCPKCGDDLALVNNIFECKCGWKFKKDYILNGEAYCTCGESKNNEVLNMMLKNWHNCGKHLDMKIEDMASYEPHRLHCPLGFNNYFLEF